jgi:hypothetical protein
MGAQPDVGPAGCHILGFFSEKAETGTVSVSVQELDVF